MEKYKLKKDTFFNKAGTICKLTPKGNMVLDDCEGACILHDYQLKEHPELLDEWFEKIEEKKYGGRAPKRGGEHITIKEEVQHGIQNCRNEKSLLGRFFSRYRRNWDREKNMSQEWDRECGGWRK